MQLPLAPSFMQISFRNVALCKLVGKRLGPARSHGIFTLDFKQIRCVKCDKINNFVGDFDILEFEDKELDQLLSFGALLK